jgi:hypothetical protein
MHDAGLVSVRAIMIFLTQVQKHMTAIKSFPVLGDQVDMLVTQDMTGGASATLVETSPPGGGPPPHQHQNEDETFFPRGTLIFQLSIGRSCRPSGSESTSTPPQISPCKA